VLDAALAGRRVVRIDADRKGTGKRLQVDAYARLELYCTFLQVNREELDVTVRHLGCQRADGREILARQVEVGGPSFGLYPENANFEYVAGLRAVDVNGAGHRVRATTGICFTQLHDLLHRRARLDLVVRMHHGLDRDRIAG